MADETKSNENALATPASDDASTVELDARHLLCPLIKPRPAYDAVRQTNGQEPILKGAHLVGSTDEDRHVI
ncbi:MAG: hypothetical protein AAFQ11_06360, partial [Pseudomonadota bacterium]